MRKSVYGEGAAASSCVLSVDGSGTGTERVRDRHRGGQLDRVWNAAVTSVLGLFMSRLLQVHRSGV